LCRPWRGDGGCAQGSRVGGTTPAGKGISKLPSNRFPHLLTLYCCRMYSSLAVHPRCAGLRNVSKLPFGQSYRLKFHYLSIRRTTRFWTRGRVWLSSHEQTDFLGRALQRLNMRNGVEIGSGSGGAGITTWRSNTFVSGEYLQRVGASRYAPE
jgi:hypothetical protein